MLVSLELIGGSVSIPFNVAVIPSEKSPVSAEGDIVTYWMLIATVFDQQVMLTLTQPEWPLDLMLE